MSEENSPQGEWGPCPRGEFERLSQRIKARHRREVLGYIAGGAAAVSVPAVVVWLATSRDGTEKGGGRAGQIHVVAGLRCDEVMKLADDYVAGKLDAQLSARVKRHIAACEPCRRWLRENYDVS